MAKLMKTMDGNTAAAWTSYAFTEVAGIFPITPSSPMAEVTDEWAANGRKNIFGQTVNVVEMQSEAGAAGTVHGSLSTGALTTTYTASQGLLLMIPNMYKIAGELLPNVIHVSARCVASHALNIFGDHTDVMACRQTGFAMLCSGSVQEVMDLAAVAHLSAIKGKVPFLHFFDGFRTSHEIQKVECTDYDELAKLVDYDALDKFRADSLNPEHPVIRGTAANPDIFMQGCEARNRFYDALPAIVDEYFEKISAMTGRDYKAFNYYGDPQAEKVIVAMGSVCDAIKETIDYLMAKGEKVGLVQIHLYRPFVESAFLAAIPETATKVAVLDRDKESGAIGEPVYLDTLAAYYRAGRKATIVGGRYGLGSKDVTPAQIISVYQNLDLEQPKNSFTIGIVDDVTNLSLPVLPEVDVAGEGTTSCVFWGLGADGTVGANKNSIKIIGDNTDLYAQAYFHYDSKKSGGVTQSHLRFGKKPIRSTYLVKTADFVACHNEAYINLYDMTSAIKPNGTFLFNTEWTVEQMEEKLPANVKRDLATKNIKFVTIDATKIARELGLGNRTNSVLQAAFFNLTGIIPIEDAVKYMKEMITKSYGKKGEDIVAMNHAAVDAGLTGAVEIPVPAEWANAVDAEKVIDESIPEFVRNVVFPMNACKGDDLPVSMYLGREDGHFECGTSAYEKRGVASMVPAWDSSKCIQCNQCSYVCPHATIRPILLTAEEVAAAPEGFGAVAGKGKGVDQYSYKMQVSPLDCLGCGSCVNVCPAKDKAIKMVPASTQEAEIANWTYAMSVAPKANPMDKYSVKGSQFEQPLLEFSGACAGCGETPYAKLITQFFGDRMFVANATGCSSIWGASTPSMPYTKNHKGQGPAWCNSLFEDNAEFGLGMYLGQKQRRQLLADQIKAAAEKAEGTVKEAMENWLATMNLGDESKVSSAALLEAVKACQCDGEVKAACEAIEANADLLVKKSQWIFGGDGWAYDIGYGGVDHVLASGEDVNIFVYDTEVYSNTGGQASKATPVGAVAKFAASGMKQKKKDLGMMAVSYGYVYVAQVAMGANMAQFAKALKEAEAYPGPSLIIAYAPCINHGIKGGMSGAQTRIKEAVACGYWNMWRYNPALKAEGKNQFILDSTKEPKYEDFRAFMMNETRYASLKKGFPEIAESLFVKTEEDAKERLASYINLAD